MIFAVDFLMSNPVVGLPESDGGGEIFYRFVTLRYDLFYIDCSLMQVRYD